ncbi:MAG TPA: PH domain-containing protein [Dehalococcoidales bacterium]|nr:PH domain-containing protein [Dehalococcoidales bacterium]
MNKGLLVYEDHPKVAGWLKLLIACILGSTIVLGLVFLAINVADAMIVFALTVFYGLLFYFILPRSYQIYTDCLKIKLGGPFRITVGYQKIISVKKVDSINAWAYSGLRLATNNHYVLEIVRKKGLNVVISPTSGELFLIQLNQNLKAGTNRL